MSYIVRRETGYLYSLSDNTNTVYPVSLSTPARASLPQVHNQSSKLYSTPWRPIMQNTNRVRIGIRQQCSKETHKYSRTTRVRRNKRNYEYTIIAFPNPTPTVNMVNWTQIEPLHHAPPVQPHNVHQINLLRGKKSQFTIPVRNRHKLRQLPQSSGWITPTYDLFQLRQHQRNNNNKYWKWFMFLGINGSSLTALLSKLNCFFNQISVE